MEEKSMPPKMRTNRGIFAAVGWIMIVLGIIAGCGAVAFGIFAALGDSVEEPIAAILGSFLGGSLALMYFVGFGVLYVILGRAIPGRKGWTRVLGMIFGALMLFSVPIGTILGVILILNFTSGEAKEWYSETNGNSE